ncbi:60S ribosomal protein L5 [Hondaea fermentalgiana]|uniref:60S ribosomal protein L5 n=1 Tax=Hondaea fermentalgiana TaxID=2315210 RepID=A0A2R5GL76_9STRA|nr:60S ribosomal protein L5 [Hondaea fermentalgiana]|eukprot:GBG29031.1 60S ribosomal protein L5 [Hondaea fermentalgiana]
MPFVKKQKTNAYYSRYQVKFRRRRAGVTDYYQRKRLVKQAKNKYNAAKYRLVARITNKQVIAQVVYSTIAGDHILASAYSLELERFGCKAGFKNYAAAYATGLLCGRRALKKVGLFEQYTGVGDDEEDEVTGEIMSVSFGKRTFYVDELDEDRRPLRVNLDVGLARTSLGAKIFGVLKGASDAGLDIPHNHKKFPGYDPDEKEYDASVHKELIFAENIAEYMRILEQEDEESGTKTLEERFGSYVKAGVGADDLEEMWLAVHKAIREDPSYKHAESKKEREKNATHDKKYQHPRRKTKEERDASIQAKLDKIAAMEESEDEDEDDEEEEEDDE